MNLFCVSNQRLTQLEVGTYVTNDFDLALERAVDVLQETPAEHAYICTAEADFDDVSWDMESMRANPEGWRGQLMLPLPVDQTLEIGRDGSGQWV